MSNGQPSAGGVYDVSVIAKVLNLTPRRVQQLVKEGVLPSAGRGKYPLVPCVHAYIDYWRSRAEGRAAESGDLDAVRARKLLAESRLAEMALARRQGEMVTVTDAAAGLAAQCAELRAAVVAMPGRYAAECVGLDDVAAAMLLLRRVQHDLLTALAGGGA